MASEEGPKAGLLLLFLIGTAALPQEPKSEPLPPIAVARLGSTPFKARIGVACLALSPHGRTLAVGPGEAAGGKWMSLSLWDAATRTELSRVDGDQERESKPPFAQKAPGPDIRGTSGVGPTSNPKLAEA